MEYILLYMIVFVAVFLIYYGLVVLRKKSVNRFRKSTEYLYLTKKYQLDLTSMNPKKLMTIFGLCNAFVIATAVLAIDFIDSLILKLCVGFVIVFPLILVVYHLLGKSLQAKYQKGRTKK